MTVEEVRKCFPHLLTDQVYFNHAAIGPWSAFAVNRINEYTSQRSGGMIENYRSVMKWSEDAKGKLGILINADPKRIAWVDNVSNALNVLAQGLTWKSGDRIILNNLEFPSNIYPFLNLKNIGVEIDFASSNNGKVDIEEIEKMVTPKTRLISISHVQFLTGYKADLKSIGELCKKRGIIFCVDAIQSVGAANVDAEDWNIDFLCGGTQKWLMSSQGVSYFYLTEELQSRINQKFVGWTSVQDAWNLLDYKLELKNGADRFQNGTMNSLGISIFDSVLDLFIDFGIKNVQEIILENREYLISNLCRIGFEPLLKNFEEKNRAGIVSFASAESSKIFQELEKRKIYCAVREGMIRLSPHFYNTKNEIDKVILAMDEIKKGL